MDHLLLEPSPLLTFASFSLCSSVWHCLVRPSPLSPHLLFLLPRQTPTLPASAVVPIRPTPFKTCHSLFFVRTLFRPPPPSPNLTLSLKHLNNAAGKEGQQQQAEVHPVPGLGVRNAPHQRRREHLLQGVRVGFPFDADLRWYGDPRGLEVSPQHLRDCRRNKE